MTPNDVAQTVICADETQLWECLYYMDHLGSALIWDQAKHAVQVTWMHVAWRFVISCWRET